MEDDPKRKTWGCLSNLSYPAHTHSAATPEQRRKLYYDIWQSSGDEYGVFTVDYSNWNTILPINNAPGNWSMQDLKIPCQKDPGPLLQWMWLTLVRMITNAYGYLAELCPTLFNYA